MKLNKTILLSFDIEEFDLPEEYGNSVSDESKFEISRLGTERILEVVNRQAVKATFFVTSNFAEKYPELIKNMVEAGHEVASHGVSHSTFEVSDLKKSRRVLEDLTGKKIVGFRMARLAPVEKSEISDATYRYESSLNPVFLPGRYNNFRSPLLPFKEDCGLLQYPISAVPGIRFPLFWLSFKNLPFKFYLLLAKYTLNKTDYFNMYSHPWEYNEESKSEKYGIPAYITKHAGIPMQTRLENLIIELKKVGTFDTFAESLPEQNI